MTNKDPVSNIKDEIAGIENKIEGIDIQLQRLTAERKGFVKMLEDHILALNALKLANLKPVAVYPGLEQRHQDKGINKDTLPFDPDENIKGKLNATNSES